ncbi:exported hypothetical protein [Rhizobium mesoamericanum STM3625]|uniref:Uncharacterized protein n=1 Tax=Rhizobium mesoamericanum STM3625 TaxID=1211777 RepID=K0Q254_9HYPH|nr:exported hypothetical protein [Rhizobium mesoamericanum STM3625]
MPMRLVGFYPGAATHPTEAAEQAHQYVRWLSKIIMPGRQIFYDDRSWRARRKGRPCR